MLRSWPRGVGKVPTYPRMLKYNCPDFLRPQEDIVAGLRFPNGTAVAGFDQFDCLVHCRVLSINRTASLELEGEEKSQLVSQRTVFSRCFRKWSRVSIRSLNSRIV